MKILLCSPVPPPNGGIASWTVEYINFVTSQGISVDLVDCSIKGNRISQPNKFSIFDEINRFKKIVINFKSCIKNNLYSVIHINSSGSILGIIRDLILVKISKSNNIVIQYHCDVKHQIKGIFKKLILKSTIKYVDKFFCLNRDSYDFLNELGAKNVYQVNNFYSKNILSHSYRENISNILFVGRICKDKGIDTIYRLARDFPKLKFNLVGKVEMNKYIKLKPANVILHGDRDWDYITMSFIDSDVFLFPSLHEGFPMAILEAMAFSLPILASNVGAISELLSPDAGIVIDNNEYSLFSNKLSELYDLNERKKLGTNANAKILKYVPSIVLRNLIELYSGE